MTIASLLAARMAAGLASPATVAVARRWTDWAGPVLAAVAALVQQRTEDGDTAVDLERWAGRPFPFPGDESGPEDGLLVPAAAAIEAGVAAPWIGDGSIPTLLVRRGSLIQTARHHAAERAIRALASATGPAAAPSLATAAPTINALFAGDVPTLPEAWQRVAVATVLRNRAAGHRLSILTGGPGTGKTTTMARLLATLLMHDAVDPQRIRIAAPTGKAADRLAGSLRGAISPRPGGPDPLPGCPPEVRARIPTDATTLHILLGANPATGLLRHGPDHPLPADLMVVDEASMLDPLLLAAAIAALPETCHVVLVGDPYQLSSVDAGQVLADLCRLTGVAGDPDAATVADLAPLGLDLPCAPAAPALRGRACALRHNFRAARRPHIQALAQAILAGDRHRADAALDHAGETRLVADGSPAAVVAVAVEHGRRIRAAADLGTALAAISGCQVLCAQRHGPWGAATIADAVDAILAGPRRFRDPWYAGRIIIVTANDRARGLSNGDVGLCWREGRQLRVFFPRPDGALSFATSDLPPHEPAWALTIHKSQGSEYADVHAVLPADPDHPLDTRELFYTAVTRASRSITVWAGQAVVDAAIGRPGLRTSGM